VAEYQLVVSNEADEDLDRLYVDGYRRWGERQADQYYDGLLDHLMVLCENPFMYQTVDHVRRGYRRSVYGTHAIYYRVIDESVEIMALVKHENRFAEE